MPTELPTPPAPALTPTPPEPTEQPAPTESSTPPELPPVGGDVFYMDTWGRVYLNGRQYPGGDRANVTVSPDGKRLMWVEDNHLMTSDVDGANRRRVIDEVDEPLCGNPAWGGDSTRLLVIRYPSSGPELIILDRTGAADDLGEPRGCHYQWSADGERIAYLHGDISGVTVQDTFGGDKVVLDRDDVDGRFYVGLNAISADGSRVCVILAGPDTPGGDAGRALNCNTIMDVATKKVVDLPFDGRLSNAIFLADGGMLARVRSGNGSELVRLDVNDRIVARSVESKANANRSLLAYTP
ncbi:hypothetical protein O7635_06110 [Asanoa sp. WMMD1127]|uniref:TolB family protein n=1 Tax=Asanoa sp. WMMD1127 TaxID=3016107 RepID=UPI0024178333|nr:hypothetical protein [Asanoa sp. WMMD1127]MDG4821428.1 hypothetical protein [Asanoa sp. WMMD1127]